MGLKTAHLAGGEVCDDDDAAAEEVLRGVPLGDAGEDLAFLVAEVDFKAEELVGFGDALADDDLGDAELNFAEVVDGDLGGAVGWAGGVGVGWGGFALGGEGGRACDVGAGGLLGEGAGAWGRGGGLRRPWG